ncbi:hypothetical protein KY362_02795 [Candidatus Woesearchaeota archaeon]|nr:hypothetical protein [Candidatus Woesearchaeota archaeon]
MYEGNLAQRLDGETRAVSSASVAGYISSASASGPKSVADVVNSGPDLYSRCREAVEENLLLQQTIPLTYDKVTEALSGTLRSRVEDCCRELKPPTYDEAMRHHERAFLKSAYKSNYGIIAQAARKSVGEELNNTAANSERKQFYRLLERHPDLGDFLAGCRPQDEHPPVDDKQYTPINYSFVETTLKGALTPSRSELAPERYAQIEASIGQNSKKIADALVQYMPTPKKKLDEFVRATYGKTGWVEKKQEFERQFLGYALERNDWDITKTAEQLEMKERNLKRRINRLEIRPQEENIAEVIDLDERRKAQQTQKEMTPLEAHIEHARRIQKEQEQKHETAQKAKVISLDERRKKKGQHVRPVRPAFDNMYMIVETAFGGESRDIQ